MISEYSLQKFILLTILIILYAQLHDYETNMESFCSLDVII
jgi:hypothetical protein